MDIEPLWAIGGWSFLSNYCMAAPKSSSPISEPFSKPPSFLQFLTLFFILLLLINLSHHQPHPSTMPSSETTKSSESSMSTMHPQNTHNSYAPPSSKDAGREFGADAHEVPSGPNPISN
ncbi:hypothetical protein VNO78_15917 [Psophocarpus tetragonolobus]|uniref:Uncharacterized protein n=1 Tax=Psophocarpus tetragonolobus TaxID=3891 RepID=A0AAN9SHC5_PSOTE